MVQKVLVGLMLPLLLVAVGLGQTDVREQLQQLLISQERLAEVLEDESWIIDTIDRVEPEPEGSITVLARYINEKTGGTLVSALLSFQGNASLAQDYFDGLLEAPAVKSRQDLKEADREEPGLLTETLRDETERVESLSLQNGQRMILLKRPTFLIFHRGSSGERQLLQVADVQLGRVLAFCEETDNQPDFCTPPAR